METKQIRQEFADTVLEVGKQDPRIVAMVADISHFALQPFAQACPGRFYNVGVCEPTMTNIAAGLSKIGFIPVIHTIAPFLIERSFEQIKLGFGYQKLKANLVSIGAGFDYGTLGSTHHCYDDFALLKNVEGSQIIYPGSPKEFNLLFKQIYDKGTPNYFRVPANSHGVEFSDEQIKFGKGILVREGKDVTIIATGPQLKNAIDSVELLKNDGIDVEIIYIHTIKPFDNEIVIKSLSKTKKCLVIEEHSIHGGIFDDVLKASKNLEVKYSSINLGEKYVRRYCGYKKNCENMGFSPENIVNMIKKELIGGVQNNSSWIHEPTKTSGEINLMEKYPRANRDVTKKGVEKTWEDIVTAKKFGRKFFDGERRQGYGGYSYNPRFFSGVVQDMIKHYGLTSESKVLDVGCAKGFMLHDLKEAMPGISVEGIDISDYAIENSKPEVKQFLSVGDARDLSKFKDKEFDLVISITTIHNLSRSECKKALQEMQRIGKNVFITVDAWRNEEEKRRMIDWNLTAETYMHVDDWKKLFSEAGYTGDYYWFIP
ncbi:MAG: transketolase C-terminal domain-containing protein [archaeon]